MLESKRVPIHDANGKWKGIQKVWTDEKLIGSLLVAKSIVKKLTFDAMKKIHKGQSLPHPQIFQDRFGSWDRALELAGLESNKTFERKFLISEIERYIEEFNHIPSTNEFRYAEGYPSPKPYKRSFGSFNRALIELGYTPVSFLNSGKYGKPCLAQDGHICKSREECIVDNSLFANDIPHAKEPLYPRHNQLNPKGYLRADFFANGYYVEYAGLIQLKDYSDKIELKKQLATVLGLKQLIVYPSQLSQLNSVFGCLRA